MLDADDLAPVLEQFKQHIISKNVASDIADKLCASLQASLVGKKTGSFQSTITLLFVSIYLHFRSHVCLAFSCPHETAPRGVSSLIRLAGVRATVRTALEEALVRVLTPKKQIDILRDILTAKAEHRPYIITFCGVNGVGKSTNLAKVRATSIRMQPVCVRHV